MYSYEANDDTYNSEAHIPPHLLTRYWCSKTAKPSGTTAWRRRQVENYGKEKCLRYIAKNITFLLRRRSWPSELTIIATIETINSFKIICQSPFDIVQLLFSRSWNFLEKIIQENTEAIGNISRKMFCILGKSLTITFSNTPRRQQIESEKTLQYCRLELFRDSAINFILEIWKIFCFHSF